MAQNFAKFPVKGTSLRAGIHKFPKISNWESPPVRSIYFPEMSNEWFTFRIRQLSFSEVFWMSWQKISEPFALVLRVLEFLADCKVVYLSIYLHVFPFSVLILRFPHSPLPNAATPSHPLWYCSSEQTKNH